MLRSFLISDAGASLVEYAVALVVVTIVGGLAATGVGGDTAGLTELSAATVSDAHTSAEDAVN